MRWVGRKGGAGVVVGCPGWFAAVVAWLLVMAVRQTSSMTRTAATEAEASFTTTKRPLHFPPCCTLQQPPPPRHLALPALGSRLDSPATPWPPLVTPQSPPRC